MALSPAPAPTRVTTRWTAWTPTTSALAKTGALTGQSPVDSVQEIAHGDRQPSSAEGRAAALRYAWSQSGTNTFHGSAYDYNRTAATTAKHISSNNRNGVARPR